MANWAGRAAAAFLLTFGLAGGIAAPGASAGNDDYVGRTPPTVPVTPRVLGQVETRDPGAGAAGAGTGAGTGGDPIPITGGDVAGLTAMGLAAVATGTVLLRRGRRAPG